MPRNFRDDARPELHQLRAEFAIRLDEENKRHSDELDALSAEFEEAVKARGFELGFEWYAVIEEAIPTPRDYNLQGLEAPEGDDA